MGIGIDIIGAGLAGGTNILGPLISGGASLLGGAMSNAQTASRLEDQHRHQIETMVEQNKFYESMANTAHQREVADLLQAGLNPILSGTGGKGAAVGTGSGLSGASSPATDILTPAVNTALSARRNEAETANIKQDTLLKEAEERLAWQKKETEVQNTRGAYESAEILTSNAKGRKLEGEIDETKYGEVMRYINRAMQSILGGSSAIRNLKD